mmetsp:Transcript_45916/g.118591  ORF Transcript_45916/g.118591 Transcript_45916/m.118591 type:complete len:97 (-) Transcript_45916:99-389(-)
MLGGDSSKKSRKVSYRSFKTPSLKGLAIERKEPPCWMLWRWAQGTSGSLRKDTTRRKEEKEERSKTCNCEPALFQGSHRAYAEHPFCTEVRFQLQT